MITLESIKEAVKDIEQDGFNGYPINGRALNCLERDCLAYVKWLIDRVESLEKEVSDFTKPYAEAMAGFKTEIEKLKGEKIIADAALRGGGIICKDAQKEISRLKADIAKYKKLEAAARNLIIVYEEDDLKEIDWKILEAALKEIGETR